MRPLIFAPCERVIVERGANVVSLISVLEELSVVGPPSAQNKVSPQVWYVLTVWHCEPEEVGQLFEQRVELINPKGETKLDMHSGQLELTKRNHRHVGTVRGFPIDAPGEHVLRLSLRMAGGEFALVTTYPFILKASEPAEETS